MNFKSPDNLQELLNDVYAAALQTNFYSSILPKQQNIRSITEFRHLPVTSIALYRQQNLGSVIAFPNGVHWITGSIKGRIGNTMAVTETLEDTASRYGVFRDALLNSLPEQNHRPAIIISNHRHRYFAAEVSTILGHIGIPTHIFQAHLTSDTMAQIHELSPRIMVLMSGSVNEQLLPESVDLCITFRASQRLQSYPQLDLYVVNEFGFLAHSTDLQRWVVYNDQYLFEKSKDGKLIVTSLRKTTQPLLRIETCDEVNDLNNDYVTFVNIDNEG